MIFSPPLFLSQSAFYISALYSHRSCTAFPFSPVASSKAAEPDLWSVLLTQMAKLISHTLLFSLKKKKTTTKQTHRTHKPFERRLHLTADLEIRFVYQSKKLFSLPHNFSSLTSGSVMFWWVWGHTDTHIPTSNNTRPVLRRGPGLLSNRRKLTQTWFIKRQWRANEGRKVRSAFLSASDISERLCFAHSVITFVLSPGGGGICLPNNEQTKSRPVVIYAGCGRGKPVKRLPSPAARALLRLQEIFWLLSKKKKNKPSRL